MPSNQKGKRNVGALGWRKKIKSFNKKRQKLLKEYRNRGNTFWVRILENIKVPNFMPGYIGKPELMPASFYIPGYYVDGTEVGKFDCVAGDLGKLMMYMFVAVGLNDEKLPYRVRNLLNTLN